MSNRSLMSLLGGATLFAFGAASGDLHGQRPAYSPRAQQGSWLEGTVLGKGGEAPGCMTVAVIQPDGSGLTVGSDPRLGGLYTFGDLKPAVYEVRVTGGCIGGNPTKYRPQRIFGVLVKAGVRNKFNITLHEGDALEEIGNPAVATQPVILISEELARIQQVLAHLQREIDSLKNR